MLHNPEATAQQKRSAWRGRATANRLTIPPPPLLLYAVQLDIPL